MASAADISVLIIALAMIWALRELAVFSRLRRGASRKRVLSIGGFTVGLIWGQAVIAALVGALSGVAALAASNLAGFTNLSLETMATVAAIIVAIYVFVRMGGD